MVWGIVRAPSMPVPPLALGVALGVALALGSAGCGGPEHSTAASASGGSGAPAPAESPIESPSSADAQAAKPAAASETAAAPETEPAPKIPWPKGCLIENAAVHPQQPWLAVACTNPEAETGAVVVVDARSGAVRSVAPHEGYVGWSGAGLLQWHPDGERVVSNIDTNGIGLFGPSDWEASLFPDDTRDGGVDYVWVDAKQLYLDTGHLTSFVSGERRFDFPDSDAPWLNHMRWNPTLGAVVGIEDWASFVAYDPVKKRKVFDKRIVAEGRGHLSLSADGHLGVQRVFGRHPAPDQIIFFRDDEADPMPAQILTSPNIDQIYWGPAANLAVTSYQHNIGADPTNRVVDLFVDGARTITIPLGLRRPRYSGLEEAGPVAWAPDGKGIALLLDGSGLVVHDTKTGKELASFDAPAPKVPVGIPDHISREEQGGLVWVGPDRLVRIGSHFVTVWSTTGERIDEHVVPD